MIALEIDQLASFRAKGRTTATLDVSLPLANPFDLDGRRYEALRFRPANKHDLRKLTRDGEETARWLSTVARLAGVPLAVVNGLSDADAGRAVAVAGAQLKRLSR